MKIHLISTIQFQKTEISLYFIHLPKFCPLCPAHFYCGKIKKIKKHTCIFEQIKMEKKNVFFLFSNISGNNGKKERHFEKKDVISVPLVTITTI